MTDHVIYILTAKGEGANLGPIFIGETSDLLYRMAQHRSGRPSVPVFALSRLVYVETMSCPFAAKRRLRALKAASRQWLNQHISAHNPNWHDLMPHLGSDKQDYHQAA